MQKHSTVRNDGGKEVVDNSTIHVGPVPIVTKLKYQFTADNQSKHPHKITTMIHPKGGGCLQMDKILDWLKFKLFEDDKMNETHKLKFVFGRVEKNRGKRNKCYLSSFSRQMLVISIFSVMFSLQTS